MPGFFNKLFGRSPGSELEKHTITSLADLKLKRTSAKDYRFVPSCNVYVRADGAWVFAQNEHGAGCGCVMVGPGEKVEVGVDGGKPDEVALGAAAIAALSRSRLEEWDGKTPIVDRKAPQSAGFKGYGALEKGAALISVRRTEKGVEVTAWGAGKGKSWQPVTGAMVVCADEAGAIGKGILDLLPRCLRRE